MIAESPRPASTTRQDRPLAQAEPGSAASIGAAEDRLFETGSASWRRRPAPTDDAFSRVLAGYEPITLARARDVALLRRVDTKYLLGEGQLLDALVDLADDYRVLDVRGVRIQRYRTIYFDTPTFDLYLRHHQGHADRYKIRGRTYVESGLSFLEVKHKNNKDWTTKHRVRADGMVGRLTPGAQAFLGECCPFAHAPLRPRLENDFRRITLVSKRNPERLTLDLGVEYCWDGRRVALSGVAIAEVKQDGLNRASDFFQAMRARGVRPTGVSKYCVGVALLYETVKHNNFKPKLRLIERITGGTHVWRDS